MFRVPNHNSVLPTCCLVHKHKSINSCSAIIWGLGCIICLHFDWDLWYGQQGLVHAHHFNSDRSGPNSRSSVAPLGDVCSLLLREFMFYPDSERYETVLLMKIFLSSCFGGGNSKHYATGAEDAANGIMEMCLLKVEISWWEAEMVERLTVVPWELP